MDVDGDGDDDDDDDDGRRGGVYLARWDYEASLRAFRH